MKLYTVIIALIFGSMFITLAGHHFRMSLCKGKSYSSTHSGILTKDSIGSSYEFFSFSNFDSSRKIVAGYTYPEQQEIFRFVLNNKSKSDTSLPWFKAYQIRIYSVDSICNQWYCIDTISTQKLVHNL